MWYGVWRWKHRHDKNPAQGVSSSGPAPAGALDFLDALCRVMGWPGIEVTWCLGRIPMKRGGSSDATIDNPWPPTIRCRVDGPPWQALMAHEVEEVELRRAGKDGEPDPQRVADILETTLLALQVRL